MPRPVLLLSAVFILAIANIGWRVMASWGLITVDVVEQPLSQVIASIQRQGHVKIETNMEVDRKVTMRVKKVPLTHALDVLSGITDSRWQLSYVFAPDTATAQTMIGSAANGRAADGWKTFYVPLSGEFESAEGTANPREDRWNVRPIDAPTVHGYLEQASRSVSARFAAPESWNPAINSPPSSGKITKSAMALARSAGGVCTEVFFLMGRRAGEEGENAGPGPGGPGGGPDGAGDFRRGRGGRPDGGEEDPEKRAEREKAREERMLAEIAKMSAEDAAKARKEWEDRKAFFESLRELTPEQRREKIAEKMGNDPSMQNRFEGNMAKRESMKTPEQRADRYRNYQQRKEQIKNQQ